MKDAPITQEHIDQYLAVSERGEKNAGKFDENPLIQGKRNRGLHMQLWEEGVLEGIVPYNTLLGGFQRKRKWYNPMRYLLGKFKNEPIPRSVVDFMKKEMFKGMDAEVIEECYAGL